MSSLSSPTSPGGSFSVSSALDRVRSECEENLPILERKGEEWKARVNAMNAIEKIVNDTVDRCHNSGAPASTVSTLLDGIGSILVSLNACLVTQMQDLRSEIVKRTSALITCFARTLQSHAGRLFTKLLPALAPLAASGNTTIRSYTTDCLAVAVANVPSVSMINDLLAELSAQKARQPKQTAIDLVETVLDNWSLKLLKKSLIPLLEEQILQALKSGDSNTRSRGCITFWKFAFVVPERAEKVKSTVDQRMLKMLSDAKKNNPQIEEFRLKERLQKQPATPSSSSQMTDEKDEHLTEEEFAESVFSTAPLSPFGTLNGQMPARPARTPSTANTASNSAASGVAITSSMSGGVSSTGSSALAGTRSTPHSRNNSFEARQRQGSTDEAKRSKASGLARPQSSVPKPAATVHAPAANQPNSLLSRTLPTGLAKPLVQSSRATTAQSNIPPSKLAAQFSSTSALLTTPDDEEEGLLSEDAHSPMAHPASPLSIAATASAPSTPTPASSASLGSNSTSAGRLSSGNRIGGPSSAPVVVRSPSTPIKLPTSPTVASGSSSSPSTTVNASGQIAIGSTVILLPNCEYYLLDDDESASKPADPGSLYTSLASSASFLNGVPNSSPLSSSASGSAVPIQALVIASIPGNELIGLKILKSSDSALPKGMKILTKRNSVKLAPSSPAKAISPASIPAHSYSQSVSAMPALAIVNGVPVPAAAKRHAPSLSSMITSSNDFADGDVEGVAQSAPSSPQGSSARPKLNSRTPSRIPRLTTTTSLQLPNPVAVPAVAPPPASAAAAAVARPLTAKSTRTPEISKTAADDSKAPTSRPATARSPATPEADGAAASKAGTKSNLTATQKPSFLDRLTGTKTPVTQRARSRTGLITSAPPTVAAAASNASSAAPLAAARASSAAKRRPASKDLTGAALGSASMYSSLASGDHSDESKGSRSRKGSDNGVDISQYILANNSSTPIFNNSTAISAHGRAASKGPLAAAGNAKLPHSRAGSTNGAGTASSTAPSQSSGPTSASVSASGVSASRTLVGIHPIKGRKPAKKSDTVDTASSSSSAKSTSTAPSTASASAIPAGEASGSIQSLLASSNSVDNDTIIAVLQQQLNKTKELLDHFESVKAKNANDSTTGSRAKSPTPPAQSLPLFQPVPQSALPTAAGPVSTADSPTLDLSDSNTKPEGEQQGMGNQDEFESY